MLSTLRNNTDNNKYKDVPRAFSKAGLAVILVLFIYLSVLNIQIVLRNRALVADEQLLKKQLQKEQQKNTDLKKELLLVTEPSYLEKIIREKLGLVKPGETAFRIVE